MTFLELCQRLRMEAGIAGSGPTRTDNQSGEALRLVEWIRSAYQDIQDKNPDWSFLRGGFLVSILPLQFEIPKDGIAPGLANWKTDTITVFADSKADEQYLIYRPWDEFYATRLFSSIADQTGRPHEFTITPAKDIRLWPVPDTIYWLGGEYFHKPYEFVLETDSPIFERFQLAIVFNALMRYAAYAAEPSLYAYAQKEYGRLINKMELEYTTAPTLGRAMA